MANKQRGEVKVQLDKERVLKFTLNSLVYAEEAGVDIQNMGNNGGVKLKDLRTLLYAGLMHEDADLTPEAVGEMIDITNLEPISKAMNDAFTSVGK
ncbi:hypothetical protein [Priestia megaterium]|uniref:hypothetical protein n=1 Tax=Priestia megaterium TaxID=1404 RepID=UPI0023DC39DB|nr:hypothetical protein [Priestia megaterium]MDF2010193.1 hypothetical protein [Priestia megaterium]